MESLITWIGAAFGLLLAVAVVVALWEQLARSAKPPPPPVPAPPRAVSVDVPLDTLAAAPPSDVDQRRAALDKTIDRMGQMGQPRPQAEAWVETRPMVTAGRAPAAPTHEPH